MQHGEVCHEESRKCHRILQCLESDRHVYCFHFIFFVFTVVSYTKING